MREIIALTRAYRFAKKEAAKVTDPENNIGQAIGVIDIAGRKYQVQIHLVVNQLQWKGDGAVTAMYAYVKERLKIHNGFIAGWKSRNDKSTIPFAGERMDVEIDTDYHRWQKESNERLGL